jgi:hypothetical protein
MSVCQSTFASLLDFVAGGGLGWNLVKIGAALAGTLAGGPIGGATAAGLASLAEAAANEPTKIGWFDDGTTD